NTDYHSHFYTLSLHDALPIFLSLYKAVGWSNYYKKPSMLKKAYENSLYIIGAYLNEELIGVIRVVGDGSSIIYIQDILVSPKHQDRKSTRLNSSHVSISYAVF